MLIEVHFDIRHISSNHSQILNKLQIISYPHKVVKDFEDNQLN